MSSAGAYLMMREMSIEMLMEQPQHRPHWPQTLTLGEDFAPRAFKRLVQNVTPFLRSSLAH